MEREEEQSAAAKAKQETEEREEATQEVRRGQARPERAVGAMPAATISERGGGGTVYTMDSKSIAREGLRVRIPPAA